jgi:RNA polymerase sigma-70 factor (ECF subfamily)
MMNQEQIEELIDRSRQNDTIAFAQLVSEFQTMVFRLAFRLLCNEDETREAQFENLGELVKNTIFVA